MVIMWAELKWSSCAYCLPTEFVLPVEALIRPRLELLEHLGTIY